MASSRILAVIRMSQLYGCRPSSLVGLQDEYESYCFDEACGVIRANVEDGQTPKFHKKYKSFSAMYRDIERGD